MNRENKTIYLLNPVIFILLGLFLLMGIIVFHNPINRATAGGLSLAAGSSATNNGQPVPQAVLNELAHNENNLSARTLEFQQAGATVKLLYQMNPDFFITQN